MARFPRKYSDAQIKAALIAAKGLVYNAAKRLGCSYVTIYKRMKENGEIRQVVQEQRGRLVDKAQDVIRRIIENERIPPQGREGTAWRLLETLGKNRGFAKRTETRIGGDKKAPPVVITTEIPPDELAGLTLEEKRQFLALIRKAQGKSDNEDEQIAEEVTG